MNATKIFIIIVGIWLILCSNHEIGHAVEEPSLNFGQFKAREDVQQIQRQIGQASSAERVLILPEETQTIVLYDKERFGIFLSLLESGKERLLWKSDIGSFTSGGLVPASVLAAGKLDANPFSDILLCYSIDNGTSNSTEMYEQFLLFFLDGEYEADPILLSAADWYLRDEEPQYYLTSDGKHAGWKRESLVMLSPATSKTACTISVWSQIHTFDHPPTNTRDSVSFQLLTYQLQNKQIVKTDEITGTHADTVKLLQALITTKRSQGEAPIFLDFSSRTPIKTEEEWFIWWGRPE